MGGNVHKLMVEVEQVPETGTAPDPQVQAERDAARMQGLSEGIDVDESVEVLGDHYRVGEKVGLMPMMRFAHVAKQGTDSADMEGMDAMYQMLRDCIHPSDWDRFERDMTAKKADDHDLMTCVQQAMTIISARPTRQRSASSSGRSTTTPTSTDSSSEAAADPRAEGMVSVADLARASGA
ncbi:hypothetical protein ACFVH6_21865 [Spirillospora sp. NPDC127200]